MVATLGPSGEVKNVGLSSSSSSSSFFSSWTSTREEEEEKKREDSDLVMDWRRLIVFIVAGAWL